MKNKFILLIFCLLISCRYYFLKNNIIKFTKIFNFSNKEVSVLLGQPDAIWENKHKDNFENFYYEYIMNMEEGIRLKDSYYGCFYIDKDNNIFIYDNYFFSYCYVYYNKGLYIFLDDKKNIIQFIIITDYLEIYNKYPKIKEKIKFLKEFDNKYLLVINNKEKWIDNYNLLTYNTNKYNIYLSYNLNRLKLISIIDKDLGDLIDVLSPLHHPF